MNKITERLTKSHPAVALYVTHEQVCEQLICLQQIAQDLLRDGAKLPTIAKRLQRVTNHLATSHENIFKLSHADKLASMAHVEKLATEWMTLAKNAIKAIKDIEEKM
jgi:hypothetical protein